MTICDGKRTHGGIVYEGWACPLYAMINERDELESKVESLKEEIGQLSDHNVQTP